jgi:flagellar assembly factor FliW
MQTLSVLKTTRFGDLAAPEAERFRLLRPLAGFPDTHFLVKVALPRQTPFVWLQSVEEGAVAFATAPAAWLRPDYRVVLAVWDQELWGTATEAEVVALLSFQNGATANLAAPILLDPARRTALQILNQPGAWGTAEPLARK